MKKLVLTACLMLAVMMGMQSCKSAQLAAKSPSVLTGEWEIVEINGENVVPGDHQPFPFIGFNTSEKRFYGNSGCNNMMGEMILGTTPGSLSFGKIAGTLMACPDMKIEKTVHDMLSAVQSFKKISDDQIAFYGTGKRPIAILTSKQEFVAAETLAKKWVVFTIQANSFDNSLLDQDFNPYITLNAENNSVSGNAGCNNIMGQFQLDSNVPNSIRFDGIAATRMMCQNMAVENAMLYCLNNAYTYSLSAQNTEMTLYDMDGNELVTFTQSND